MEPGIRKKYNSVFNEEKYRNFILDMNAGFNYEIPFRVAESPVFIPETFSKVLFEACYQIISFLTGSDLKKLTANAIPAALNVPGETPQTLFLALDFGICKNENGEIIPQLIELQGFPSLFGWQHFAAKKYRQHFFVPENYSHLFGMPEEEYIAILRRNLLGTHRSENVILLEVEPERQNTYVDFLITEKLFGIKPVCISKVLKEGKNILYESNGRKIPVHRIYNRVIFDELLGRKDLQPQFNLTDEVDVEWAGHPNWFFRISKYLMPMIKSKFVPGCFFLNEMKSIPADLENYVLKPLFSFSGSGIKFHLTKSDLDEIKDPHNYILQKKVFYEPVLRAPGEPVKVELRILFIWEPDKAKPVPVNNMARLSKGEMIGVKYNKNKTWVGGSVAFYDSN